MQSGCRCHWRLAVGLTQKPVDGPDSPQKSLKEAQRSPINNAGWFDIILGVKVWSRYDNSFLAKNEKTMGAGIACWRYTTLISSGISIVSSNMCAA